MSEQSIHSDDMALKRFFQDFYRVPDYQREYVWGEADPKGQRGDEVEQFLRDIQHLVPGGLSEWEKVEGRAVKCIAAAAWTPANGGTT